MLSIVDITHTCNETKCILFFRFNQLIHSFITVDHHDHRSLIIQIQILAVYLHLANTVPYPQYSWWLLSKLVFAWRTVYIVASALKDPICHSNECQIGSFSSEATICYPVHVSLCLYQRIQFNRSISTNRRPILFHIYEWAEKEHVFET